MNVNREEEDNNISMELEARYDLLDLSEQKKKDQKERMDHKKIFIKKILEEDMTEDELGLEWVSALSFSS